MQGQDIELRYLNDKAQEAFDNVTERDSKIDEWIDYYESNKINTDDNLPSLSVKDTRNYVRTASARIANIFMQNDELCRAIPTKLNTRQKASNMSKIINYQFNNEFDKYDFCKRAPKEAFKIGTVVCKTGWEYDVEYRNEETMDIEEENYKDTIADTVADNENVTLIDEGTYDKEEGIYKNVKFAEKVVLKDNPTTTILNLKDFAIDPAANSLNDARYIVHRYKLTLSEIRKMDKKYNPITGIFENTDKLINQLMNEDRELNNEMDTGSGVDTREETYDFSESYLEKNPNKEVTIYEYHGEYDIDNDGRNEEVIGYFTENVKLLLKENDMPVKRPYIKYDFDKEALEKWGNAFAEYTGETQSVRTALVRYIIAATAMGVKRQTIYDKNALTDPYEERKLEENLMGGIIGVNGRPDQAVYERATPPLKADMFNALQMMDNDGQSNAGIGRYPAPTGADSATEASIIANQSETLFNDMFHNIKENLFKPLFKQWIKWNNEFLSQKTIIDTLGQKDGQKFLRDDFVGQYDVQIVVSTRGITNMKVNQLVTVMQQMAPLIEQGVLERSDVIEVFAKMNEYWGHKDIAQKIRQRQEKIESKEVQQKIQQMAMQMGQQLAQQQVQQFLNSNEFRDMVNKMVAEEKEEDFVSMFKQELVKSFFSNKNQGGNQ